MLVSYFVKVFFSTIELTAMMVLSLSMFRFQFLYYLHKISGIALLMSLISFYFRDINELSDFAIMPVITTEIILVMIVYRLPIFYSMLVCIPGFLAVTIIEAIVFLTGSKLHIYNEELIRTSATSLAILQIASTVITLLFIYLLRRRKIGFLFKVQNLASRRALKGYNFILSAVLVISLVLVQIELMSINSDSVNNLLSIVMAGIFLIGIAAAYKHNKKIIVDKYERPVKDELHRLLRDENR
ncbi:hypothetical protein FPZ49_28010 [Paenibacillus cremeus]|uniref:AgrC n=2 Tax=Paenibacillus cremeus TaxID=2163881 RepID=A0A559K3H6_9BACL|nr:hypothetical protein FPZ49_28010 [Paenibacillus cremeus]